MSVSGFSPRSWWRMLAFALWACFPALLLYILALQGSVPSRSRLALAALTVPPLAAVAYVATSRYRQGLSRADRVWALSVTAVLAMAAVLGISSQPTRVYLFTPRHTLQIDSIQLAEGQRVDLRWFNTSLGDVSLDSLVLPTGWSRTDEGVRLNSGPGEALSWRGWTGDQAILVFSGSPGAVIRASWDGSFRTIDFSETGGRAEFGQPFIYPWWTYAALGIILWGSLLYIAVAVALGSGIRGPTASLPAWAGWASLTGLLLLVYLAVWSRYLGDLDLAVVLALSLLLVSPVLAVSGPIRRAGLMPRSADSMERFAKRHALLLTAACALLIAFGIFGESLWATWSMRDDHEIMLFVGPGRTFPVGQVSRILQETELGMFGLGLRFRPTYWFLRLLEMAAWGPHPSLWHAARILMFSFGFALYWWILRPSLGWFGAGLLCAYTLTFPYWGEIVAWIATGESYAVVGLALFLWGFHELLKPTQTGAQRARLGGGVAVLLGIALCVGSKENFLPLAIPCLFLAYLGVKRADWVAVFAGFGGVLFSGYVATAISLAVLRRGTDIYGASTSLSERLLNLQQAALAPENVAALATLAVLAIAPGILLLVRGISPEKRASVLGAQAWLGVLFVLYCTQIFFYNGRWPAGSRFDFPGMLYLPAAVYILFGAGLGLVSDEQRPVASRTGRAALSVALIGLIAVTGYGPNMQFAAAEVEQTHRFVQHIGALSSTLEAHPDYALVLESSEEDDFVPVMAYDRFLRAYGTSNRLFLRIHGYSPETARTARDAELAALMQKISIQGKGIFDLLNYVGESSITGRPGYSPLAELDEFGDRCFSLALSRPVTTKCRPIE